MEIISCSTPDVPTQNSSERGIKITRDHILTAWTVEPTLCYGGFGQGDRTQLVNAIAEIQLCYDWLQQQDIAKRVTPRSYSSYYLKHMVEWSAETYVSNGALLAAIIIAGVPYRRYGHSHPNAACAIRSSKPNRKLHGDKWRGAPSFAEFKPMRFVPIDRIEVGVK